MIKTRKKPATFSPFTPQHFKTNASGGEGIIRFLTAKKLAIPFHPRLQKPIQPLFAELKLLRDFSNPMRH